MAPPPDSPASPPTALILERGQTIDRFVVLGLVGRGGMGEVYAAYDPELDRKVAIKLLRTRGDAADGRTRLLREAQAIAKLQHPNVVVVFDVGTFGDSVFIAMEFVEGRTVSGWLHAATRTRREILDIYLAAGRGLAAAHAAGLVHRDFKPDNVMVTNDGQVRVMDFGLARHMSEAEEVSAPQPTAGMAVGEETLDPSFDPEATADLRRSGAPDGGTPSGKYLSLKLTQTGAMLGTPAYMAPEQFAVRATDARTDQFSFCVALYEALYGQRPFAGDTFLALMTNVTTGAVRPPPAGAGVPGWMRRVLVRGLQTEPAQRFPSMNALLAALATDPNVRVRRVSLVVLGLAVVALVGVAARRMSGAQEAMCHGGAERWAGVWEPGLTSARKDAIHRSFAETHKSYAEQAFTGVSRLLDRYVGSWLEQYRDACEATHVRGEQSTEVLDLRMTCLQDRLTTARALSDLFASADGKVVENAVSAAGALPTLDPCSDVATLKAVVKPPENEATRRRVEALRADKGRLLALGHAGHCREADTMAGPLIERVRATGYQPLLAETLDAAAYLVVACGDAAVGVARYHEAYDAGLASHDDDAATEAAIIMSSMIADRLGRVEEGRTWLEVARAMLARIGRRPVLESWFLDGEGTLLSLEGHVEAAVAADERARVEKEKLLGPDHPDVFTSVNNVGFALLMSRDYSRALVAEKKAEEGIARVLGPEHPMIALSLDNEGEILNGLGRYPEAQATFERVLDVWKKADADPFFLSYGLTGLGRAYLGEGKPAAAVAPLEDALRIRVDKKFDPEHLGETRFALACALWARPAARDRALALAREALADYAQVKAPTAPAPDVAAWLRAPSAKL